jgi:hypothetical protein
MTSDPTKGWLGVGKIANDLGSSYYNPAKYIPMQIIPGDPTFNNTTSDLMYDNSVWIESKMDLNSYIYDRGSVGNNSQYYNMEVGRTMNFQNVINVTPFYNNNQSIRIYFLGK